MDPGRRRPGSALAGVDGRSPSGGAHRSSTPRAAPTRSSACASGWAPHSSLPATRRDDPLEARQLADARARLNEVDLRRAFRPRLARRPLAVAGVGLAMTLLLVAWPNPQDDLLDQRRAAREAAERVAERVEEVADEIGEENVENPDPRREELERQLRELARQLREQGDDREATLARIGSVQEAAVAHGRPAGRGARRRAHPARARRLARRHRRRGGEPRGRPGGGGQRPRGAGRAQPTR